MSLHSLTDTKNFEDSALVKSVFMKTAYRHVCFGMAYCQTFSNLKIM